MTLFWIVLAALALIAVFHIYTWLQIAKLRRSGLYPQAGQASMADVERLLRSGRQVWAIRCYREIHGGSLRQAKEAVKNLSESHT